MDIYQINGHTDYFSWGVGRIARFFRLCKAKIKADVSKLEASYVSFGKGPSCINLNWGTTTVSMKANLAYPEHTGLVQAYSDLQRLGEQTGLDFTYSMRLVSDSEIFGGTWMLKKGRYSNEDKDTLDKKVVAAVRFPCLLESDEERAELAGYADKVTEPVFEGGRYWTAENEHSSTGSNTPMVRTIKSWDELNEREVLDFFNNSRKFGKPQYMADPHHTASMKLVVREFLGDGKDILTATYFYPPDL